MLQLQVIYIFMPIKLIFYLVEILLLHDIERIVIICSQINVPRDDRSSEFGKHVKNIPIMIWVKAILRM